MRCCDEIALDDDEVTALFTRLRTRLASIAPLLLGYRSRENRERELDREIGVRDARIAEGARLSEQVQSQVASVTEAVKAQIEHYVRWAVGETRLVDAKVTQLEQGLDARLSALNAEQAVRDLADGMAALRDRQVDAIGVLSVEIRSELSAQASRIADKEAAMHASILEREAEVRTALMEAETTFRKTLLDNEAALREIVLEKTREVAEWRAAAAAAEGQRTAYGTPWTPWMREWHD
ncbi:hypothetical protein [Paraburkholderia sp. CI3]|uniref:hypothetical protein n=1 Tax=Paraburkholderia sp. CI3 TaxID=2991060 RepID=UPI003D1A0578